MQRLVVIIGTPEGQSGIARADAGAIALATRRFKMPFEAVTLTDHAGCDQACRWAMAAGASNLRRAANLAEIEFDVALVGAGVGMNRDRFSASLALTRNASLVLDVIDVERTEHALRVTRDLGRGSREVLLVEGAVVLAVAESAVRLPYISHHRRANLKLDLPVKNSDVPAERWQPIRPRTKSSGLAQKTAGTAADRMQATFGIEQTSSESMANIVEGDAETCARHLLRFLAHHGFIARKVDGDIAPASQVILAKTVERRAEAHVLNGQLARGPRGAGGVTRGIERRPRSVAIGEPRVVEKLARGPRSIIGASRPIRGPFPAT